MSISGWSIRKWDTNNLPAVEVQNDCRVRSEFTTYGRRCYVIEIVRNFVHSARLPDTTREWFTRYRGVIEGNPDEQVVAAYNGIHVYQDDDGWIWTRPLDDDRSKLRIRFDSYVEQAEHETDSIARMLGSDFASDVQHSEGNDG